MGRDYVSIYDGSNFQSPQISKFNSHANWNRKSFSSSGNHMLVQFLTDHEYNLSGFSAKLQHIPINTICKDWFNITTRVLTSSEYSTIECSWIITASIGSTISIQFHTFQVK